MQRKSFIAIASALLVSGCFAGDFDFAPMDAPQSWTTDKGTAEPITRAQALEGWWKRFDDSALNVLVDKAMMDSPDRGAAEARIMEARGLRRTSLSFLFPQIGASTNYGRQDPGFGEIDYFYDAGFDAAFELDVFGYNRNNYKASDADLIAAEAAYHDITLTLVADIVRNYIDYRAAQHQVRIAQKNLQSQEQTLSLVEELYSVGESPRVDVDRTKNLAETTRASIPEFKRQAENARLRLSVLTGAMPEELKLVLEEDAEIPGSDITPVMMLPAKVLEQRPDIQAATATLMAKTRLTDAATARLFPVINLSGFYGVSDGPFVDSTTIWDVAIGAATTLLNFGRIEGHIDAAEAREKEAYELYRKTVLEAVTEVETALSDYDHISEQYMRLQSAHESAQSALEHSQTLYKEGEIGLLDVLDAQRSANQAEASMVNARAAQAESLTRIYKSMGIY